MEKNASRSKVPLGGRIPVPPPKPLPLEDVPMWTILPYDTKYPHTESDVTLSRQELGKRLHQTYPGKEFDLTQCPPAEDSVYNSLHDPHLRHYFQSGQRYGGLVRRGLVTRDGQVKSRLQEFNQYRMYLYHLWAMQVNQASRIQMSEERNRLEGLLEAHDSEDPLFNDFAKKYERIKVEEILEEVATEIFQNKSIIAEHGFSPFVRSVIQWKLYQEQLQKNFRGSYPAVKQWLCDQTRHYKQIMERKLNARRNKEKMLRSRWEQICEVSRTRLDREERRREQERQRRKRLSEQRLHRAKSIWDKNQREIRSRTQRNCKSLSDLFSPNRYITAESDDFLDVTRSEGTIGRRQDSPSSACYETESFTYSPSSSSEDNLPQISEEGIPVRKAETLPTDGEISDIVRGVREALTVPKDKTRSIQSRRKVTERKIPRDKALGRKKSEVGKIQVADSSKSSGTDDFSDAPEKRDSWEESNVLTMAKQTTSKKIEHRGKSISADQDEISDERGIALGEKASVRKKLDVGKIREEYSSPSHSWTGDFSDAPEKRASSEESNVLTVATQTPSKKIELRGKAISADEQEISDENRIIPGENVLDIERSDAEKIRAEYSSPLRSCDIYEAPEKRLSLTELDALTAAKQTTSKKYRGKAISADEGEISDEIKIILEDKAEGRKKSEVEKIQIADSSSSSSSTGDISDAREKRASAEKLDFLMGTKETTSKKILYPDKSISADDDKISNEKGIISGFKALDIKRSEVEKIQVADSSSSSSSTGEFYDASERRDSSEESVVEQTTSMKIKHGGKAISADEDEISNEGEISQEDAIQPSSVRMIKADRIDYGETAAEVVCLERDGKVESLLLADSLSFVEQTTIQLPLSFEDQSKLVQLLYGLPDICVVRRVEDDSTHLISVLGEQEPKDQPESEPVLPSPGTDLWMIPDSREYKKPDCIWKTLEKSLDESKRSRQELFGLTDEKIIARSRENIFGEFCGTEMGASLSPSSHDLGSRRESIKNIVERVKWPSEKNVKSVDKSDDGSELRASEDVTRLDLRSKEGMRKYIRKKQFLSKIDFPKAPLGKKARGVRKSAEVRSPGDEKDSISRSSLATKEKLKSEKYRKEKLDAEFFYANFARKDIEKVGVGKILEDNKYKIASDSETAETKTAVYSEHGETNLKKTDSGSRSSENETEGAEISNILKGVKAEIASDAEPAGSKEALSGERERKWEEYDLKKTHSRTYLSEPEEDEIYSIRKDTVNEIVSVSGLTSETKRVLEDEKRRHSITSFVDNRGRKSSIELEKCEFSNEQTTRPLPPLRQGSKRIRREIMKKKTIPPTKPLGIDEQDLISASDVKHMDTSKKSEKITNLRPTEIIPYTQTTRPVEIFGGKQLSSKETNGTDIDSDATTESLKGLTQIKNGNKEYETLTYTDDIPTSIRHSKSFTTTPPDGKQADFDQELERNNLHFYQIRKDSNEFSVKGLETADFIENWGPLYDLDEKDDTLDAVSSFTTARQEHVSKQRPEIAKRWKSLQKPTLANIVIKKLAASETNKKEEVHGSCGSTVKTDKTSVTVAAVEKGANLPAQSAVAATGSKQFKGASKRVNGNTHLQESAPFNDDYSASTCAAPNLGNIDSIVLTAQPEISEDKVDKIVWEENASFSPVYSDFQQIEEIPAKTLKWIERDMEELSLLNLFETLNGASRLSPSKCSYGPIKSVTVSFEYFPLIDSKSEDKHFQVLEDSSTAVEIVSEVEERKPIIDIRREGNKNTIPFGPQKAPLPSSCSKSIIAWFEGCFGPVSKKESEEYLPKSVSESDAEEYLPKSVSEGATLKKHVSNLELDSGFRKDFSSSEDEEGMGVLHSFDKNQPVCEQNNNTDEAGSSLGGFPAMRNLVADEYETDKENADKEDDESDDKSDDGSELRASEEATRLDFRSKEGMRKNIHRKHISSNIGFPKAPLGKIAREVCKTDDGKSLGDENGSISRSSLAAEENLKSEYLNHKLGEEFFDAILLHGRRLSLEGQSVGTEPDATLTDFDSNRDNVPQISTSVTDKDLTALKQSSLEERGYRTPSPKDSFVVEPFSRVTKLKKEKDSLRTFFPVIIGSKVKDLEDKVDKMIRDRGHDSMSLKYQQQIEIDSEESDMMHKRRLLKNDGAEKLVGDDTTDSPDTSIKQKDVYADIETALEEILEDVQTLKIKKPKLINDSEQIASENTVPKGKLKQKLAEDSESETNHAGRIPVKAGEKMAGEHSAVESELCEHQAKPTMHFTDNDEQILPSFDTKDGENVPNGEKDLLEDCIQMLEEIHIQCPTSHVSKIQAISLDPDEGAFHQGETKEDQDCKGIFQETGRNSKGKQSPPPLRQGSKRIKGEIMEKKDITPPKSLGIEEKDLISASDVQFLDASVESKQIENFISTEMISYLQPTTRQEGICTAKKHSSEETNRTDIGSNTTTTFCKGLTQIKNESKEGESLAYPDDILISIRHSKSFTTTPPDGKQVDFDQELERNNLPFNQIRTDSNKFSVERLETADFIENWGPSYDLDEKDDTLDAVSSFTTARQEHVSKQRPEIAKRLNSLHKPTLANIVVKNLASSETNVREGEDDSCGSTVKTDDKTSVTAATGEQGSNPPAQSAVAAARYTTGSEKAGHLKSRDRKNSAKDINRGARAKTKSKRIVPMVPLGKLSETRSGRDFIKSTDIAIGEEETPVSTEYAQCLSVPTAGPSKRTSTHPRFETDVGGEKRFRGVRDDQNSPLEEGLDFPSRVYRADDGIVVIPSNVLRVQHNNADVKRIADEKIQRLEQYFVESVVNVEEPVTSDDSQSDIRIISEKLSKLNL